MAVLGSNIQKSESGSTICFLPLFPPLFDLLPRPSCVVSDDGWAFWMSEKPVTKLGSKIVLEAYFWRSLLVSDIVYCIQILKHYLSYCKE